MPTDAEAIARLRSLIARDEAALKRFESGHRLKQESEDGSLVDITDDEVVDLRRAIPANKEILRFLTDGRD